MAETLTPKKERERMAEDLRNAGLVYAARPSEHNIAGTGRARDSLKVVARKRKPK